MSSNAFASSRPRVRHQRVPRTRSCDHPRFIQLVNEIARINEAKKKQEEVDRGLNTNQPEQRNNNNNNNNPPPPSVNVCATGIGSNNNCCNPPTAPQTSYGYRSLEPINQSSSALHDNYHQAHQQQQPNHHHNQTHSQLQQHQPYQNPQQFNNNVLHQEERCPAKTSASFGFSKQNVVVEQNDSDFADSNPSLAQDENRSKRKRSTIDYSGNPRKSSSSSAVSGASKRHKSSETARPLSPSFTKCPICLLDCLDRDPSFTNTCFHLFCYVCIESWSKNKATCPLCRTKFTKIIYNIKSATSFAEKVTSPIRRDDDDVYIADRHYMLEHLSNLNSNSSVPSRNNNGEDVQFLFENLRNQEVLMPQYFVNQMDHRQGESLHSFNTVTSLANFNPNVPTNPFAPTYPMTTNYAITLSFPQNRIASTSAAIASAYTANSSLTDLINDPNSRRISRSGRYIHSRNYERPTVDSHARVSRTTTSNTTLPLERLHHHQPIQQHPHPHQHQDHHHQHHSLHHHQHHHGPPQPQPQHHQQHQSNQSRSIETIDMSQRQSHRVDPGHNNIQLPYTVQPRPYGPNVYVRRPYNSNPQVEQQNILDTLYPRQMPDM